MKNIAIELQIFSSMFDGTFPIIFFILFILSAVLDVKLMY